MNTNKLFYFAILNESLSPSSRTRLIKLKDSIWKKIGKLSFELDKRGSNIPTSVKHPIEKEIESLRKKYTSIKNILNGE